MEDDQNNLGDNIMSISNIRDKIITKDLGNNNKSKNKTNIKDEQTEKVNNLKNIKKTDLIPYTIMTGNIIQNNKCNKPLLILLDSGSNKSFIKHSSLPHNVCGKQCEKMKSQTIAGEFVSNSKVTIKDICLP